MEAQTDKELEGLRALRAKMSAQQRQEMAEVIQNEMERRGMSTKKSAVKSSGLSSSLSRADVEELYRDVGQAVQQLRVKKLEERVETARQAQGIQKSRPRAKAPRMSIGGPEIKLFKSRNVLMFSLLALGAVKVFMASGALDSAFAKGFTAKKTPIIAEALPAPAAAPIEMAKVDPAEQLVVPTNIGNRWSPAEKELLTQLDNRRVELEKRREALDHRESDIRNQAQAVAERLVELRSLVEKLTTVRKERDQRYETRLTQLASVYGTMEPQEASQLVAKLDDTIALELLERMPEKKMGQVLGYMEKNRAVDLTKLLSEKKNIVE